jgi:hypothetical protein
VILWRRLDTPGHDACRLERRETGWQVEGTAVLLEGGAPGLLWYRVICDAEWRSVAGEVRGWVGERAVRLDIARTPQNVWTIGGVAVPGLEQCVDLDLGFTPATNLFQLRRLALEVGQAADAPVAWLESSFAGLRLLPQRYERRSDTTYLYDAPTVGYHGLLEVDPTGFVRRYPGIWELES